jgi:Rps23 Pro-64 3,4-dihydroxylase Tpa1-like proline 4-hydroxylase
MRQKPKTAARKISIEIDPAIDKAIVAKVFRQHGRIHIPGFLKPRAAERIYRSLSEEVPWQTHFNLDDSRNVDLHEVQVDALGDAGQILLTKAIFGKARDKFTFIFNNYPITDAVEQNLNPGLYVNDLQKFVNSAAFLNFVREITGIAGITYADAQATLFRPGHFLTVHNDLNAEKGRLAAFVMNFSPEWRTDWGGLLQFIDEDGHISEAYKPCFNALNIFRVPQKHAVSYVTPFAGGGRYSITGWLRA